MNYLHRPVRSAAVGLLAVALLSACAAGPDFHAPAPPQAKRYTNAPLATVTAASAGPGGAPQTLRMGADLPGEWWHLFGSKTLDDLVSESIARHPSLLAQQAALREARDNLRAGDAAFMPALQGSAGGQREQVSGASIAPGFPGFITNVFQATVGLSYSFDLFGGERRTVERLRAQVEQQRFLLEASYLTLTSNVASTTVQLASLNAQIAATREIIDLERAQLELIRRQFAIGIRTEADVMQQRSNLAGVQATLPALLQQRDAASHALAALTGRLPAESAPVRITLADLRLPAEVPVSVPSALTAQRPDLREQLALMHQASAAIGIATANMLPSLNLTGAFGGQSLQSSTLFSAGAGIWNVGGSVAAPLFQGGRLLAERRSAVEAYRKQAAIYRETVLNAFQNVADSLTALGHDAEAVKAESDALDAAQSGLGLIKRQYDAGAVSYVSLLSAQQAYQQARIAYIRAVAGRYTDTIALIQALGGGWWHRDDLAAS
ncbi:MAG: efflux transporter outer membrane subunit [Gammaproteobacteria bacterium]|nr:efflux transporter outer membrane subunit [Gammaproteobacteria bacterium]